MANDDRSGALEDDDDDNKVTSRIGVVERPVEPTTAAPTAAPAAPIRRNKLSKKERKLLKDQTRALDSWERYRALTDVVEEALDLVDLADHKARFALVIMGALNALLFLLASATDVFDAIPVGLRPAMTFIIVVYALVAVFFVVQAIESLRPRKAQPWISYIADHGPEDHPVGLRFYEDIVNRSVEDYRTAWRDLRIGQLNAELAVQGYALAQINKAKYAALRRLYLGLQVMTIMAVTLMAVGSYFVLSGKAVRLDSKARKQLSVLKGAADIFAEPTRLTNLAVKEPSGVAVHPGNGHLFVVGDDGRLSELDGSGRLLSSRVLAGNLEDVVVHAPTGDLLVLSELTSELIVLDASGQNEKRRFKLDHAALLGQPAAEANQGFEGLAFRPDAAEAGGGVFYLTNQRGPAMVVAIAFDPARAAPASLGAEVVKARWPLADYEDLTAITYVAALDRLLIIADKADELLVMHMDGHVERRVELPGEQQEGLAMDAQGTLWVADDKDKSVLKIEGALSALQKAPADGRGTGLRIPG